MSDLENLRKDLRSFQRPGKAKVLQRFFKTGPGEYGEGDEFLGLVTEETRSVAKKYLSPQYQSRRKGGTVRGFASEIPNKSRAIARGGSLSLFDISELLASKIHEERVVAVMILTRQFRGSDLEEKKKIYDFYFDNITGINNWDLVDGSAPEIVGGFLDISNSPKEILYKLAKSENLWKRRISMMATFYFIKNKDFSDALKIAEILVQDKEDLIQKAVGWMLREIGNKDVKTEEKFLEKFSKQMPRTMLRYAIEKFPEEKRQSYLKG